jgi:hypothetical protein
VTAAKSPLTENELRDLLAVQLAILEPGLSLIDKEKYVPHSLGTRGFIDLLACDAVGHFVLIELKRSDTAAREAIHEAIKYVEAVKEHFGARAHELRVFVVSTNWHELLVPFSRFVTDCRLSVQGFEVSVEVNSKSITAFPVTPLKLGNGRLIAPWHELNFYKSESSLQRGIHEYEKSCRRKGVDDYILVILDAAGDFNETAKAAFRQTIISMHPELAPDDSEIETMVQKLDRYDSVIYFGMQMLDRGRCIEIIEQDSEQYADTNECLPGMSDEEAISYLHESIFCMEPRPHHDSYEIGYPAKFQSRLLDTEGWKIREIRRYGLFERNQLITDDDIVDELSGSEGTTGQRFKRRISVDNPSHVFSTKDAINKCLEHNPVWRDHMACCRFRGHRVRCFGGTGGVSWSDGSLHESSSLRLCG